MSPTLDIHLLLHGLDVDGGFLLDEVQQLDGVGHPEENVLQVRDQVSDCEVREGCRILAGETERAREGFQTLSRQSSRINLAVCPGAWP